MQFYNLSAKQVMACEAITDILKIFADTEIGGQYEINHQAICDYLDSLKFVHDYFECETKEDVYTTFTQDIYDGLPVWRFLILPEWTKNIVEKSFQDDCKHDFNELAKKYKCLTCKYHSVKQTSIGTMAECTYNNNKHGKTNLSKNTRASFEPKTECENYKVK